MPNKHGDFIWYELISPDPDGAAAFYGAVVGWDCIKSEHDPHGYREWWMADAPIGGLLALTPGMEAEGAHPGWYGYVAVDNVDQALASMRAAGATVTMEPRDIAGVGRVAMILDPQGASLYVMTDTSGETSHAFAGDAPRNGHCAWNELSTSDPAGAMAFYCGHLGWVKDGEMDMGPMGSYEFVRHGSVIGAIMPKVPQDPWSHWLYYFRVANIDAAAAKVKANGGTATQEPQEVPGGDWIIQGQDPQGVWFALVGQRV
jgi:uncharacterized protein